MFKRLGIGTYRMALGNDVHYESLLRALTPLQLSAFSVVDTSPNYGDGRAELIVGKVLEELREKFGAISCSRDGNENNLVDIVTKFGYLQGTDLKNTKDNAMWPGVIKYTEECYYCIHPDFIHDQLNKSIGRLGVKSVDTYMVHNPEHILIEKIPPRTDVSSLEGMMIVGDARAVLMESLESAFIALEDEVEAKRIGRYGVSCNSFALPSDHPHFVPFESIIEAAHSAARKKGKSKNSLCVFQMPGNVLEHTALMPPALGGNGCAKYAQSQGMETVVNRALTAFDSSGSWRLAEVDFPNGYKVTRDRLFLHLDGSSKMSDNFATEEERIAHKEMMTAAKWLTQLLDDLDSQLTAFSSVMHYQDDLMRRIIPMINSKIVGMDEETSDLVFTFFSEYEKAVRSVSGTQTRQHLAKELGELRAKCAALSNDEASVDMACMPKSLSTERREPLLQEYSLGWLKDHPHVSTVLLGALRPRYVDEANELFRNR